MTPAGVLSQAYRELTRRGFDTARLHPSTGFNDAFVALWDAPSKGSAVHIAVEPPYWFVDAPGHHWTSSMSEMGNEGAEGHAHSRPDA